MKWMKDNGLRVVIWICGLVIVALGGMSAFGVFKGESTTKIEHLHEAVKGIKTDITNDIKPRLRKADEHRIADEIGTKYFERRFDGLEKDLTDFTSEQRTVNIEQRSVNLEILKRLPPKPD